MKLTLNTAKQPFHKTFQLVNMHCQTKLVVKKKKRKKNRKKEHIIEIAMISLCEPKFSYCDLDLEDRNPFFAYDALAYNDVSPYWVWLQKVQ